MAFTQKREPDRLVISLGSEPFRVGIELQAEAESNETVADEDN